jgi:putative oxidoreductase
MATEETPTVDQVRLTNVEPPTAAFVHADNVGVTRALPEHIGAAEPEDRALEGDAAEGQAPIYPGVVEGEEPEPVTAPAVRSSSPVGVDLASLILRWALGALLLVRGTQELFGWFGGQGGVTLASQLERLGYDSFATAATAVSIVEVVVGVLLVVGLFTEWACGVLVAISMVAVLAQHRLGSGVLGRPGTGLGADMPGLEVVGGLGVLAVALALLGAGRVSLDRNRYWSKAPLVTALIAIVLGLAAGALLVQPQLV